MAKRRIVDAHHHLWPLSAGYNYPWLQDKAEGEGMLGNLGPILGDYTVADYRDDARDYDIEKSVHIEAVPADARRELDWLSQEAAKTGFPHGIVARVVLEAPDAARQLDALADYPRLRGVREIVNWHPDARLTFTGRDLLADPDWRGGYALLARHGLSFDLQLYPGQMQSAADLAAAHPDILVIVNHAGMPIGTDQAGFDAWRRGMDALAARPNVAAKISGLGMMQHGWTQASITPFVRHVIAAFGTDRVMFGSNFPVDRLYSSFARLYGAFEAIIADLGADEQDRLFRSNAIRIYRL